MKKILAVVNEASYLDNYENGKVDGTFNIYEVERENFDTVAEALTWFKNRFQHSSEYEIEAIDEDTLVCARPIMRESNYGFIPATEKFIEEWKVGKRDLYNAEYQMKLWEVKPVIFQEDALSAVINENK